MRIYLLCVATAVVQLIWHHTHLQKSIRWTLFLTQFSTLISIFLIHDMFLHSILIFVEFFSRIICFLYTHVYFVDDNSRIFFSSCFRSKSFLLSFARSLFVSVSVPLSFAICVTFYFDYCHSFQWSWNIIWQLTYGLFLQICSLFLVSHGDCAIYWII